MINNKWMVENIEWWYRYVVYSTYTHDGGVGGRKQLSNICNITVLRWNSQCQSHKPLLRVRRIFGTDAIFIQIRIITLCWPRRNSAQIINWILWKRIAISSDGQMIAYSLPFKISQRGTLRARIGSTIRNFVLPNIPFTPTLIPRSTHSTRFTH